jgi:methionine-rich copper-binding protein CopC
MRGIGRLDQVSTSRSPHRLIAVLGVLAGLLLGSAASPALAHDEVLSTDPADGAVLDALPEAITLTFSGVLLDGDGTTEIVVTDASGTDLTGGEPLLDGVRVTQPLTGAASGSVEVAWRVVSSDGHPISGEFSFAVGDASSPVSETPATDAPATSDTAGAELLPVWIGVGVIAVAGAAAALLLTRRRPSHED